MWRFWIPKKKVDHTVSLQVFSSLGVELFNSYDSFTLDDRTSYMLAIRKVWDDHDHWVIGKPFSNRLETCIAASMLLEDLLIQGSDTTRKPQEYENTLLTIRGSKLVVKVIRNTSM